MDGVLVDSVKLNWQAMNAVLAEYGKHIADKDIKTYLGRSLIDQVAQFNSDFGLQLSYTDFEKATSAIKAKLFAELEVKAGVKELLKAIHAKHFPIALATSMPRHLTKVRLETVGILKYFDPLVTEEDVAAHKPAPDIYLKAAESLKVSPGACIVFEDAPAGITSAKSAGMMCVAVETPYVPPEELAQADVVVKSLSEVDVDSLLRRPA